MDHRVLCPLLEDSLPVKDATAFRLIEEVGGAFFLDFLFRHPNTQHLEVVLRVRMQREALAAVKTRLTSDVVEFPPVMAVQ